MNLIAKESKNENYMPLNLSALSFVVDYHAAMSRLILAMKLLLEIDKTRSCI
jgi:hypothetical protein